MSEPVFVRAPETRVFVRELDRAYPLIERGEGVWLYDREGTAYLDAVSGGALVTGLGPGPHPGIQAAPAQAPRLSFVYNHPVTTPAPEALAGHPHPPAPARLRRGPL